AIRAQGAVGGAQGAGQNGEGLCRQALLDVIEDDKVVAGAVHFPKLHGRALLSGNLVGFISAQTRGKIKAKKSSQEDLTKKVPGAILFLYKRCTTVSLF